MTLAKPVCGLCAHAKSYVSWVFKTFGFCRVSVHVQCLSALPLVEPVRGLCALVPMQVTWGSDSVLRKGAGCSACGKICSHAQSWSPPHLNTGADILNAMVWKRHTPAHAQPCALKPRRAALQEPLLRPSASGAGSSRRRPRIHQAAPLPCPGTLYGSRKILAGLTFTTMMYDVYLMIYL